jgi:hypothetical protein
LNEEAEDDACKRLLESLFDNDKDVNYNEDLVQDGRKLTDLQSLSGFRQVTILRHPPRCREEWSEWNACWPIAFRTLGHCAEPTVPEVSDDDYGMILQCMEEALRQSQLANSHQRV